MNSEINMHARWKTNAILDEILGERIRQEEKWGEQNHIDHWPDDLMLAAFQLNAEIWKRVNAERVAILNKEDMPSDKNCAWDGILLEEVFEALEQIDSAKIRAELIQVAAVAVAWVEAIDRRLADGNSETD
jgi:hypothetical protein